MSLRKITTLLLLAAFALTQVPVQAASLSNEGQTPPSVIADAGSPATGANRDVVPVNIVVDATGSETVYTTYDTTAANTFNVDDNGALFVTGANTRVGDVRLMILTPPTGTSFVGLAGYNPTVTSGTITGGATNEANVFANIEALADAQMPFPGDANTESAILAKILTEPAAPVFFGGQTIAAGSVVVFFITNQDDNAFGPSIDADIKLENIGLAVDAGTTLPAALDVTYVEPLGSGFDEAINLADGATLTIATPNSDSNGQIAVAIDSAEADGQSNAVLADLLADGASAVNVNVNNTTSTTVNQSVLYVDTDALLIQAGETPASTIGTPVYYDTPFNTSAFVSGLVNGNTASVLNTALTNATVFPNSANALITVTYSLVTLTGNGSTDATLALNAASVSLSDQGGADDGYLGALAIAPTDNGAAITSTDAAVSVLYQGANTTTTLPVVDFDSLGTIAADLSTVSENYGYTDFGSSPTPLAVGATGGSTVLNGTLATGLFSGVNVVDANATGTNATLTSAAALTPFTIAPTTAALDTDTLWVPNEVTARLLPTGGNAIYFFSGTNTPGALTAGTTKIGSTNLATVPYNTGASLGTNAADDDVDNNAILAARLSGNVVSILPFVNKVDDNRDVIKVRPEATITLGASSKTTGVRLIATVTGNNIAGSKVVEIARINAAGATDVDIAVKALPAAGDFSGLLAENGTDSAANRVGINIGSINTTNTSVSALVANGSVLDDTLPSFFCGGTAGTTTAGPNSVPQQAYARTILVEESTAGAFDDAIVGGGNDRIRFTLPVGVDLIKTNTTAASNDVSVVSSSTNGPGTFSVAPAVTDYQTISEQKGGQAFIDVSYSAAIAGTGAETVKKAVGLIFQQYSLVIPENQTDFDVTVTLVNDDGASTTAGDTVLDTLGTAPLATGCAEQFTISYCDDALAEFAQGNGPVESDAIANGSLLTSFSDDVSSTIRLVNTETTAFRIPDICVTEAVSDAIFAGSSSTTPVINFGTESISLAISDVTDLADNTDDVGFVGAGAIFKSDDSLNFSGPTVGGSLLNTNFTASATGVDNFNETTTIRFTEVTLGKTNSNFQPSVQNFTVFTNDGSSHIATSMPAAFETRGTNGTALSTLDSGDARVEEVLNVFFNGDNIVNDASATTTVDATSGNFFNGKFLNIVFSNTDSAILTNAVKTINDSAADYSTLNDDTKLSVAVDDIAAVTNGLAAFTRITVFSSTGDLEPGSLISVVASSGDSVVVPVNDSGNFVALIRGSEGDTLQLTQTPTSDRAAADQVVVITAEDQNLEPTLLSASSQNFAELGTLTQQGTAPVMFKITAVGRVGTDVFLPTAADLRIGGTNPVYAVPGTNDTFLAIVDFRKTDGNVVSAPNVAGAPEVVISGMDVAFPTFQKRTRPRLARVNEKTRKNGESRVVFKGRRLRNAGVGFFVTNDGSVQEVTFRRRTSNDKRKNRVVSEAADTLPTDTLFGVYHVPGRGITTLDLSN